MSERDDLKSMIEDVSEQEGVIVIRVLRQVIDDAALEQYGGQCDYCQGVLEVGETGYLAGMPTGTTYEEIKGSRLVTLPLFCSEVCLHRHVNDWGRDIDYEDMMVAFYG